MSFGEGDLHERIAELESSLDEVAGKWAEARVDAEAYAKRCKLLESLASDLWRDYCWATDDLEESDYTKSRLRERMEALGLMEGDE